MYIDVWTALVSHPSIGKTLLGSDEYANLAARLQEGDHAILLAGAGRWSFKGSGYVRGGIFDRFHLIQEDISHRFFDREHKRLVRVSALGAPDFIEKDIFIIPAKTGFDPAKPWHLQFLVHRPIGPIEKLFRTYELPYTLPDAYITITPVASDISTNTATQSDQRNILWKRIWDTKTVPLSILIGSLVVLTFIFFFQIHLTRHQRSYDILRTSYLLFTLFFVGWYANAQLSVVNVLAVLSAFASDFRWETFLMDPLIFVLWLAVAASILFWARGAYCGWLCPFGALQELTNKVAKFLRVPQISVPWSVHERLWALKYILFLGLFGVSIYSLGMAERLAEIEPFKTAIILKFNRPWPYVLFALFMLLPGLFIERFYCRYLCPLGAALAIPARLHMFRWLRRYHDCGNPCQLCAIDCPVKSIHPTGEINPNECISCLNCQILYQDKKRCPVVIRQNKRRVNDARSAAALSQVVEKQPAVHNKNSKENKNV